MSSGTQVDLDWTGMDAGQSGTSNLPANAPGAARGGDGASAGRSAAGVAHLTDEEILGMEPVGQTLLSVPEDAAAVGGATTDSLDVARDGALRREGQARVPVLQRPETMPAWMQALASDPKHAAEAQSLWQEHQAFRAVFSSAEEARAIKELLPGGAQEVQALRQMAQEVDSLRQVAQEAESLRQSAASLREAAQSVDRIDAAIFSGDARAQSEVVAEMARTNPAAFRSMFAEAAKVLAGMGQGFSPLTQAGPTLRKTGEGWGTQQGYVPGRDASLAGQPGMPNRRQDAGATSLGGAPGTNHESQFTNHESRITNHESQPTKHQSPVSGHQSPSFDPAAYASFERSTNDVVARDVRGSINDTLGRVLPEGVAEGAARRIGEDIFNEVHRALAADRSLSEQVGQVLRERRFGSGEQQRVASLLAGRAKQLVPSVARRVIGEWTSSVLGTARTKAARQAAAAARIDIAAPGGSLDSMPLRAMSGREVNYASMSDDEILGM